MQHDYSDSRLLIDGQWVEGAAGQRKAVVNPATGERIGWVACAEAADLERALQASQRGFEQWRRVPALQRWSVLNQAANLMEQRLEAIARVLTQENGKPLAQARGEVQFCAEATRWYAEEGKRAYGRVIPARSPDIRQTVLKEPVGPALGFAAWNFPGGNVTLKMAAALAAGCSIIVKPSDETPATAAALAQCFQDAGAPAGVVNVVYGEPAPISQHLIGSPIPRKVSLTGSTPVGKLLQKLAADSLKRCTMELGGHAPVIVHHDADLEKALDTLVRSKFRNAGQVCTSPTRFYVHASVYEAFIEGFVARTRDIRIGNGLDEATTMGPLTVERKLAELEGLVSDAVACGARLVAGGKRIARPGFFFEPTVLRDVPDAARIMREEPFGPVVPIASFHDEDEVMARANSLPYGLAAYVFTKSAALAKKTTEGLNTGVVGVNHTAVHEAETPFGGVNESGYGSESGIEGLDAYMRTKFVTELHE